jgi:hypothetical protein
MGVGASDCWNVKCRVELTGSYSVLTYGRPKRYIQEAWEPLRFTNTINFSERCRVLFFN